MLQAEAWAAAAEAAHAVAGQAAMVGAKDVARRARALQGTLENEPDSPEEVVATFEGLEGAWRRAEQALLSELERRR
ncbi:MAG: Hpt domain-containing protein [Myxococcales bacterium]